jgi:hypothetical protein
VEPEGTDSAAEGCGFEPSVPRRRPPSISLSLRDKSGRVGGDAKVWGRLRKLRAIFGNLHLKPPTLVLTDSSLDPAVCLSTATDFPCCALSMFRACCHHYPGRPPGCVSRSLRRWHRPSPLFWRVGSYIGSFEACSVFKRPFLGVLHTIHCLLIRSQCFLLEREFAGPVFHRGEQCTLARRTEQSSRKLASGGATARAQDAAVQVGSLRPAVSQHVRRRPQHLQSPTPSHLALDAPALPSRGGEPMENCGYRR